MKNSKSSNRILCRKTGLLMAGARFSLIEQQKTEQQKGFTLIELSIVLVIIGLIVGGVLTGQDLIQAAKTRATVGQYEKFNTGVNTFNVKFNGIPGDLQASTAEAFGFGYISGGGTGNGDGDGFIGVAGSTASAEGLLFWSHLFNAGFIPNNLPGVPNGAAFTNADQNTAASIANAFPISKFGSNIYWFAAAFTDGYNYFGLTNLSSFTANGTGYAANAAGGMTPVQAFDVDVKIDDGVPNTGIVQSIGSSAASATLGLAQAGSTGSCINTANTSAYSGGTSAQSRLASCSLRLRFN